MPKTLNGIVSPAQTGFCFSVSALLLIHWDGTTWQLSSLPPFAGPMIVQLKQHRTISNYDQKKDVLCCLL